MLFDAGGSMWFVCLFFYGLLSLLTSYFEPLSPWVSPVGILLSTALVVAWLVSGHQGHLLTLKKDRLKAWPIICICLFPVLCKLLYFGFPEQSALDILCIFFAAVREEIVFRGIIIFLLCRRHTELGMLLSGIFFAAAHLLNLENAEAPALVLYQALYALAAGIALSGVVVFCQSLLPCIGVHFLNNLTAGDAMGGLETAGFLFWFSVVVWLVCGFACIFFQWQKNRSMEGDTHETIH